MKILTIVGARPQFIKAMAISSVAARIPELEEVILHTGQHYDENMSDVFFTDLGIPMPRYNLKIGGGSHGEMTGKQLIAIEEVILKERPDVCLVYGDTNSTLSGSLAAAKLHVPVAHVEAGLRSFNKRMPEEINRILTDNVSRWLFTPTDTASQNLKREGFSPDSIHQVGDVMYDVVKLVFHSGRDIRSDILSRLDLSAKNFVVATLHRQETTDQPDRLLAILKSLADLDMPVVLPLHPRTAKIINNGEKALRDALAKLRTLSPVGYVDMGTLVANSALVVTDSGGLQKEASFHKVPCVTVREETEWVELVDAGWNKLPPVLADTAVLSSTMRAAMSAPKPVSENPYGDGHASDRVLNTLLSSV